MTVVGDRYRLDRELGTGGTATVWLAHDQALDRAVAVKLLLQVDGPANARRERLRTEARALAALDHPNVVKIWDLGQHAGRDFIVMEYLERGSLADRLAVDGPVAPGDAVQAVLQVLDALGAAHAAGIVHRDVKPGNVLVRDTGAVALCDFGIARTVEGSATETGVALGSLGYMAPEQRLDARRAGPGADLYAAACTLFNLLTNDTPVDLYLALDHSPRWDHVPQALRAVLRRATRSEPSARFADAAEMAEALRAVLPSVASLGPARARSESPTIGGYVPTSVPPTSDRAAARSHQPEPSIEAELRVRVTQPDDWRWSQQRARVGRPAVWVGAIVTVAVTGVGLVFGPLNRATTPELPTVVPALSSAMSSPQGSGARPDDVPDADEQDAEVPQPAPAPAAFDPAGAVDPAGVDPAKFDPAGTWQGSFAEHRATLVLSGPPAALTGDLVLRLGQHELHDRWVGQVAPDGAVVLTDPASGATCVARPTETRLILEGELVRPGEPPVPFALVRTE